MCEAAVLLTTCFVAGVVAVLTTILLFAIWKHGSELERTSLGPSASIAAAATASGKCAEVSPSTNCEVVISGVSVGLPGSQHDVFNDTNWDSLCRGECRIELIDSKGVEALLARNVIWLKKDGGLERKIPVRSASQTMAVSARLGKLDLEKYGVSKGLAKTMGKASRVAVAAGFEALKDAKLLDSNWKLAPAYRDTTGVIYATSFPALDAALAEVSRYAAGTSIHNASADTLLRALEACCGPSKELDDLRSRALNPEPEHVGGTLAGRDAYAFDRKFLFKVLVLANAQLAQLVGARGPNFQSNAACAGTTQAIAIAADLIKAGRCDRVVVISGDDASGDALMPWLGNGFNALGAASLAPSVESAIKPFDQRRNGMVVGAGACSLVVERRDAVGRRARPRCRLVDTHFANSAFHGAAMDKEHIAQEFETFVTRLERDYGIDRKHLAEHGIYLSHETGTHATPSSSCAANEIHGLNHVFKDHLKYLQIVNTKAITGHPMGVGIEDALAAFSLSSSHFHVPPLPADTTTDANLKVELNLPKRGNNVLRRDLRFALRFAAGFGSQVAFALYASTDD